MGCDICVDCRLIEADNLICKHTIDFDIAYGGVILVMYFLLKTFECRWIYPKPYELRNEFCITSSMSNANKILVAVTPIPFHKRC